MGQQLNTYEDFNKLVELEYDEELSEEN